MMLEGVPIKMPDLGFAQMQIDINVLGLRDLLSSGLLPVKKAYVQFSVKSLLSPSKAKAVQDVFTEPGEGGSDPNIRTVLKIGIRIPSKPAYCPRMSCQVFDKLYFDGMNQPILGSFSLNLGKIMAEDQAHHQKVISQVQEFNQNLSETIALKKGEKSNQTVLEILHDIIQVNKIKKHKLWKKIATANIHDNQSQLGSDNGSQNTLDLDPEKLSPEERKLYDLAQKTKKERREAKEKFLEEQKAKEEKEEEARMLAEEELSHRKDGSSNVIKPVYKLDPRLLVDVEVDIPNKDMFLPIGYNKEPTSDIKHYRRYYTKELEKVPQIMPEPPFMSDNIYRQIAPSNSFGFGDEENSAPKTIIAGRFKGLIQVYNEESKKQQEEQILGYMAKLKKLTQEVYETQLSKPFQFDWNKLDEKKNLQHFMELETLVKECGIKELKIDEYIQNYQFQTQIMERLNQVVKGKVFFYILDGFNFAKKGLFGDSDPFLVITCGRQIKNEREFYQIDEPNPKFFKCFDFFIDFPGAPVVTIEAFDKDDFFGDSLIGLTKIDLDDRFYNKDWTGVEDKPIEYRNLMHPSTTISQGAIKLWVEIYPEENKLYSSLPQDITPEPVKTYELRFIIWKTKELITTDFEDMCDPYFRSYLTTKEEHFTDTHWRCQTGIASYNWRNLIKIRSQQQSYLLNIQCYDKDIFTSDVIIGECSLDLAPIFSDSLITEKLQVFTQEYWNTWMKSQLEKSGNTDTNLLEFESKEDNEELFWLPLRVKSKKEKVEGEDQEDVMSIQGYVQCSFRIYPTEMAEKIPQGVGREEPNNDPNLPPPEGRLELSLNPIKMFNQLVDAKLRRKICIALCIIICISLCVFICPFIPMLAIQGVGLVMQIIQSTKSSKQ